MKIGLATTTINEPLLLTKYAADAKEYATINNCEIFFVVAGDRKTPESSRILCEKISGDTGIEIEYLDPNEQLTICSGEKNLTALLKWDCIQRRNIAGLRSLQKGAEIIMYIDDDNHITNGNYFADHLHEFISQNNQIESSSNGYLNIMRSAIGNGVGNRTYPRGFPFALRDSSPKVEISTAQYKVAANAGLWLEEADIDAVTRIATKPIVDSYNISENATLALGTWTPINSQNTAFLAKFMPGYFLSSEVGRYDDIYAGYVFQKLTNHFGYSTSYGKPIVTQHRNEHDLLIDLQHELSGMRNIDFIVEFIRDIECGGDAPVAFMNNLLDQWEKKLIALERNHSAAEDLRKLLLGYRIWVEVLAKLETHE
jgi:hypothetical protein